MPSGGRYSTAVAVGPTSMRSTLARRHSDLIATNGGREIIRRLRAADDLKSLRARERDMGEEWDRSNLRARIDQFRADQQRAESHAQEALADHYARNPDQLAPQPEQAEQPAPANSLAEKYQRLDPELKAAIEQQAMAHESARRQYTESVRQLGEAVATNAVAQFPELAQGNGRQVLEQLRISNPARYAEIAGHIQKVQQIGAHYQQLQTQQQQDQARAFQHQAAIADSEYDSYVASRPAHEKELVQKNLQGMFDSYQIDAAEFAKLYNSSPVWRSSQMQRALHDLALFHAAKLAAAKPAAKPVPRVMKPGEVQTGGVDNSALAAAMKAFNADPNNPRLAARALTERRRAATRR